MDKKKRREKGKRAKQPLFQNRRLVVFLLILILPIGLAGGYIIAKTQRPSTGETVVAGGANGNTTVKLSELYKQVNCVCGTCDETLATCPCKTAKEMRDQIASAWKKNKKETEILDRMVARYGRKVLTAAALSKKQPLGRPKPAIHIFPNSHDFGTIPQKVVSKSFTVMNAGNADLNISKMTTSCGCTTAEINKKKILPGETTTLKVTFDPIVHDTKGKTTRTVSIESDDPLNPVKRIKITAFVQKEKKTAGELPSYAYNSSQTLEAYRIATQIPGVLEVIPCYCGCGTQSKHRHLKDCFIKADGAFDDHGSGCNLCDREAVDVKKWFDQKVPIKEIRARIDKKYKEFGAPTPTPPL